MDCSRFISKLSNRRKPSILRKWAEKFMETPNGISLANGMPNTKTFPFKEISVSYKDGSKINLTGEELGWSLQYGPSQGYLPLLKKMRDFQKYWYEPKQDHWDVIFTIGSMHGCAIVFEMLLEVGDPVMLQTPTYSGILNALYPMMPEFLEIPQDQHGIIPEYIAKICKKRLQDGKKMPKILYVNPTGSNPTGTVLSDSRKREVYELAKSYDFLILEDDPYYFLHFRDQKPTTFFELDTDGRVIRLDSFSKVLSSGLRLGVVSAHKEFIKKMIYHMEASCLHASSLSQMLLYKLLETWDMQKWQEHFDSIQKFYRERRDIMLASLQKHLTGLAEWNVPEAGMFVWIKITGVEDVTELAIKKCVSHGLFVIPGHAFNSDSSKPDQHLRLSFSFSTPEQIEKAISIMAKLIREEIDKRDSKSL
ncbi:kynurenine/alpha-aminoadipate aminotransferase, mitochondrial [Lasioglossum baleicum]|uniref:kynurenine/alpha-aminoadipate aminotransferase, mitochondrial n=1 Tax=Lasioglossum baleicum TaxID=434251 RepID=UPI003FCEBE22